MSYSHVALTRNQSRIRSSSAVLLPDGSWAQDGEFEADRATVELIRSLRNCEVGRGGIGVNMTALVQSRFKVQ